jgi:putative tryptophan/tyrosine transport system substrate-binding protein
MKRRQFVSLLGATLAARPWASGRAHAQTAAATKRIGVLIGLSSADPAGQAEITAFREGLASLGWTDGRNLKIEYRWPGSEPERMRAAARELAGLRLDVLVTRTTPGTLAMRREAPATPIVFAIVAEPVESGLVQNMARPGGNITGFTNFEAGVSGKWLELLKAVAPQVSRVALMYNPKTAPFAPIFMRNAEGAARTLGVELKATQVSGQNDIEAAIRGLADPPGGGLVTLTDSYMTENRDLIIAMTDHHRVPAVYTNRNFPLNGGLIAYVADYPDLFRRTAGYVDRILKGAKPGDLPVQQPNKYELIVNLKTARAQGITVPSTLLATADEVIE